MARYPDARSHAHALDPTENGFEPPAGRQVPISDIFVRLGGELEDVAKRLGVLEGAIGELVMPGSGLNPAVLSDLQYLDSVRQTVAALSEFACNLTKTIPGDLTLDPAHAASLIKLEALARRLLPPMEPAALPIPSSGDLELL